MQAVSRGLSHLAGESVTKITDTYNYTGLSHRFPRSDLKRGLHIMHFYQVSYPPGPRAMLYLAP